MKNILLIVLATFVLNSYAQDKYNSDYFNKLTEVEGTHFVIATVENWGKTDGVNPSYLVFIDTKNGQKNQVNFPDGSYLEKIEQIKIDELGINRIIVSAKTIDLDGKKGIDWSDPKQIIILSTDGKERVQLTTDKLFVRTWVVNKKTGTIVITGHYDANNNGKYDKADQNEIAIYDLKTLKLINKL